MHGLCAPTTMRCDDFLPSGERPRVRGQGRRGSGGAAMDTPPQDGSAAEGETPPLSP